MPVFLLPDDQISFPSPELAEEDGLLAIGGDLSTERLILAYRNGIFPWFSEDTPILWYSTHPRLVLFPEELHIQKSMRPLIHKAEYEIRVDSQFEAVMRSCRSRGKNELPDPLETWITEDMIEAYCRLHRLGWAHSVEVWSAGRLAGGLYGVAIGRVFFGESMFSAEPNMSKLAFYHLARGLQALGFGMIDCQMTTGHLVRMGAREIPRSEFLERLYAGRDAAGYPGSWAGMPEFSSPLSY